MNRIVVFSLTVVALLLPASASAMSLPPSGVRLIPYAPTLSPVTGADPVLTQPLGVGPVALGGSEVRIQVAFERFPGAVDIYIGILAPALSQELLLVGPGPTLRLASSGFTPWRSGVTGPVREDVFPAFPSDLLPVGAYSLYAAVAPAGSLEAMYLWETKFVVTGPCRFVGTEVLQPLRNAGANGTLVENGSVKVGGTRMYHTDYAVDVGLWIDDSFLDLTTDAAALALRYFEHANCIYGVGNNVQTGESVNAMSFRLFNDEVRYFEVTTPPVEPNRFWIQQVHWDWRQAMETMAQSQPLPKVNVLITARNFVDPNAAGTGWAGVGGASNGVGQGQAIVVVGGNFFENGMVVDGIVRDHAEDWWGVIVAHELGHAMGRGGHIGQQFNVMCCTPETEYTGAQRGTESSHDFGLSDWTWQAIWENHLDSSDRYNDPYSTTPNPVTDSLWNFDQVYDFLKAAKRGDVLVAPSTGSSFAVPDLRHDWFCINDEVCLTGDFNGDGRHDLAAFTRGTTGDVYVALSTGTSFAGTGVKWHDFFSINDEVPLVGDFNGDGLDDIASFTRGRTGDVYVALSTGTAFSGKGVKWHDFFSINDEVPLVGDFNGDGRDDIASFTGGTAGDVYVALSTGSSFSGTGVKWHDFFAINQETPASGDVDGDGRDDIVTFAKGSDGRVYAALSNGTSFSGTGVIWTEQFCLGEDVCRLSDVTGDGRADAVAFKRNNE